MKNIVISLCVLFFCVSCLSEKDRYIKEYDTFVQDIIEQGDSYTQTDWEDCKAQYEDLRTSYSTYKHEMSQSERQHIDSLNSKINAKLLLHETSNVLKDAESTMNEVIGTLGEILEELK